MKTLVTIFILAYFNACGPVYAMGGRARPTTPPYQASKIKLWATYYNMPSFLSVKTGIDLRDKKGKPLGIKLTLKDFCSLAMEGSGFVDGKTLNYAASTSDHFVKGCKYKKSGRVKFYITKDLYGVGNRDNPLTPFVSIACDQKKFKYGQKFYIKEAVGTVLPDGGWHNGIFICEDVGGLIKGNHIDVFIGPYKKNPFDFVKSNKNKTFIAELIK